MSSCRLASCRDARCLQFTPTETYPVRAGTKRTDRRAPHSYIVHWTIRGYLCRSGMPADGHSHLRGLWDAGGGYMQPSGRHDASAAWQVKQLGARRSGVIHIVHVGSIVSCPLPYSYPSCSHPALCMALTPELGPGRIVVAKAWGTVLRCSTRAHRPTTGL